MPYKNQNLTSKPIFKKIIISFAALAVILLLLVIYFSLAKVTIILTTGEENKSLTVDLMVAATSTPGATVGKIINEQMTISQDFTVANFTESPGVAEGQVKIINTSKRAQTLIKTTRLLTPEGLLFRLKEDVSVPAGKEIITLAHADQTGGQYNIQPTKFTIPGLSTALQQEIYAVLEAPMTGGVKKTGVLTENDLESAQEKMKNEIKNLIKKDLEKKYPGTTFLINLINYEIINQKNEPATGATVDKFSLIYQLAIKTVSITENELILAAQDKYKNKIIENSTSVDPEQIVNWQNENFEYWLKEVAPNNETAIITTKVGAQVSGNLAVEKINKKDLAGFDTKGVEYYFSQYPGIKQVTVDFWPFWVKSTPASPERITIITK